MGYNTTIVIMNDALREIREDQNFGQKVADAVSLVSRGEPVDVSAGNHGNAATVIETHHADTMKLIAVGGNFGYDMGCVGFNDPTPVDILRDLADRLGYRLVKKAGTK